MRRLLLTLALTTTTFAQKPVSIQILAVNDFHGAVDISTGSEGMLNGTPAGGAEYLATHLKNARRENPNSIFVSAGDVFGGSPLLSALFDEKPTIEAMNAMHLDLTALGNHELDHGPKEFLRKAGSARFHYLGANVLTSSGKTLLFPTAIRTIGGVKIGFIGESTTQTPAMLMPASVKGLTFTEEAAAGNTAAASLERQGVHAIVLLIHEGGFQHPASGPQEPNSCDHYSGDLSPLLDQLTPAIKVVLSGHTHVAYNCTLNGRIVTNSGHAGRALTRIQLSIDPKTDRVLTASAHNEITTRDVPKDPVQTTILSKYRPLAEKKIAHVEGSLSGDFTKQENAAGESSMGDLIADAQLAATRAPANGGAQIAFMNPGGIRADLLTAPQGSITQVTYGTLYTVQPFGNRLTVFTLSGDQIRRLLEQQFPEKGKHILQVSSSLTYQYRLDAPQGEHIVPGSLKLNGNPIQPTDKLRIEASDFMASGAEGLTVFKEATDRVNGPLDLEALIAYLHTHTPLSPRPVNRIERLD
ncbi:bifunctional metallophosphatase/5'-nucleotidase [Terriglobus tenax]|uniref:bifunctional metallophosphatase/5'-nucleotidase n=1 Tax=Terriglobus tenax TaxID=1111115 RepID=UPI0021E05F95|nr:bifunctional UDP-sugar hydrolase/5'-nucleotidase [Terriglobus tenax]